MLKFQRLGSLFLRRPSLKGHTIEGLVARNRAFRVYGSVQRQSLDPKSVLVANASKSSIAELTFLLEQHGCEFEAIRLRNGDVCCVTKSGALAVGGFDARLAKAERSQRHLSRRPILLICSAVALGASLWIGGLLPSAPPPASPSPAALPVDCQMLLDSSHDALVDFLESGKLSVDLEFEQLTNQQNGGIRSVDTQVSCSKQPNEARDGEAAQRFRATLKKVDLAWLVKKVTRLDN